MSDSRELAVQPRASENLLAQVIAAAKDPAVDATKMKTLAELVNSQQDREREIEFNISKNAAISEMPVITKTGRIVITDKKTGAQREQGRFARFEDIYRVVRPILEHHSLAIAFEMNERPGGGITVTPILSHANGHTERGGAFPLPAETSGSKNAAQAMGSAASYGKRYAMCGMLNIVTEGVDDDGHMGRGRAGSVTALPFEREQQVRREAEAALAAGTYDEWFRAQSPKDRGWLVDQDFHKQVGGPALPRPEVTHDVVLDDAPPADETHQSESKRKTETPAQWVKALKDELLKCVDIDTLEVFWDGKRDHLNRLKDKEPALWQEADDAYRLRHQQIVEGKLL